MAERDNSVDVAIIGGGAAGLATTIFAARGNPRLRVALFDGAAKLGAKILISGGGRCNVTNALVTADDFNGGSRHSVRRILQAFDVEPTVAFFGELGVTLHVEQPFGKLFPDSNRARSVLDALVAEATRRGVELRTGHRVIGLVRGDAFELTTNRGRFAAERVVLATGGLSVPQTGSDGAGYVFARQLGHTVTHCTPALVPLVLENSFHTQLSGISQEVELTVATPGAKPIRCSGPMLWTHFGVSGPVVLDASRHWHAARLGSEPVVVTANLVPGHDATALDRRLLALAAAQPRAWAHNALSELLPARVARAIVDELGITESTPLARLAAPARRRLAHALVAWPLPIRDSRGFAYAEVTAGGVPLGEINPATMASRPCPGLYLVGEILDVDGRLGGFNFQWSWSTAWVAGAALAR